MLHLFDPLRAVGFEAVTVKMLVACLCGTVIGLERSSKNRPAGFRTHILTCLAAAVAALTSLFIFMEMKLPADISRIGGQVISGLGFIGAGTIVVTKRLSIKGLTTAAGLWTTGIIGLAIGSGYYELGLIGTALVLLTETVLMKISLGIKSAPEYTLELLYNEKNALDRVLRHCKDSNMAIVNLRIHTLEENAAAQYAADISLRGNVKCEELIDRLHQIPDVVSAVEL